MIHGIHGLPFAAAALLLAAPCAAALGPQAPAASPGVTGWVVYWDPKESLDVFEAHAAELEEVAVFGYHFDESCQLVAADAQVFDTLSAIKSRMQSQRPRLLITAVNDVVTSAGKSRLKDARCVHQVVFTAGARAAHIDQLLQMAAQADGVELDYESFNARDREDFSKLVGELADALHARGKWLSVVVQAKTDDHIGNGAGAMDWRAIAAAADRVKIMAYYFHYAGSDAGPVAPPTWVEAVARFALTQIPKEKLCVALSLYGFDWGQGKEGRSVDYEAAMQLAAAHGAAQRRDAQSQAPYFQYTADGVRHQVWFEDALSLREKITRLRRTGVPHIGVWHLGSGAVLVQDALHAAQAP